MIASIIHFSTTLKYVLVKGNVSKGAHQKLLNTFFTPLDAVNASSTRPAYTTWTGRCLMLAPKSTVNVALDALPRLHARSTVIPPRTRAPRIEPEGHWAGSAGSRVITSGEVVLDTSGACRRAFWQKFISIDPITTEPYIPSRRRETRSWRQSGIWGPDRRGCTS